MKMNGIQKWSKQAEKHAIYDRNLFINIAETRLDRTFFSSADSTTRQFKKLLRASKNWFICLFVPPCQRRGLS